MWRGVGPSGLPINKSMMSSPARRAAILSSLVMLKTYGGSRLMRENSGTTGLDWSLRFIGGERTKNAAVQKAILAGPLTPFVVAGIHGRPTSFAWRRMP